MAEQERNRLADLNARGAALKKAGRLEEATQVAREVQRLAPDALAANMNLGIVLAESGKYDEALPYLRRTVEIQPEFAQGWSVLGTILQKLGMLDEAEAARRRAVLLEPRQAAYRAGLAANLLMQGRTPEAVAAYGEAVALDPSNAWLGSELLMAAPYMPDLEPAKLFEMQKAWAARHADPLTSAEPRYENDRSPERRLRVGYISPDFRDQVIGRYTAPIFEAHDRSQVEVFCYSNVPREDAQTARIKAAADHWRPIAPVDDAGVAEMICVDRIDVLVDLALHVAGNRLLALARKPAPVQVNYLGYPGTSGMRAMDYCIKDARLDPVGASESLHSEQIMRLDDCYWCYPKPDAPEPGPLPARARGHVTFGALGNVCKLNDGVLRLWARIMSRVPMVRLALLVKGKPEHNPHLTQALAANGIDVNRVDVLRERATREYLALYAGIDLTLDPFPVTGHTTTLDSLWMGVPVVTLAGRTAMGRAGVSVLATLGLDEFIADSPERYVEIAVALAGDLSRLTELRATLRGRMERSPLTDHAKHARNLEALYRQMWVDWCARRTK